MRRGWSVGGVVLMAAMSRGALAADEQSGRDQPPQSQGDDESDEKDLAKKVQNPIADLISVPFQNNTNYNIGPNERAQNTLNIQPVIPVHLSERVMLITRTILPIVYQPDTTSTVGGSSGLGDLNPAFFFSPANPGKLMYGVGPIFTLPTATQRATGSGKWCVGPAAVALMQPGHWTFGLLVNQLWSIGGPDDRTGVSFLTMQYFVNYNLAHAWYLASQPIITADFKASGGDQWTVPFGGGVGKIFKLGKLPLNGSVQGYKNVRPNDSGTVASWQLRVQIAFLFPTGSTKAKEKAEPEGSASNTVVAPRPVAAQTVK
jgi:hypothetical protein